MDSDISHIHINEETGPEMHLLVTFWLSQNTA